MAAEPGVDVAERSQAVARAGLELCGNGLDDDSDGAIDEAHCLLQASSAPVSDDGIVPERWADNPACEDLGFGFGFKVDGLPEGTFPFTSTYGTLTGGALPDPGSSVTITDSGGSPGLYFDWSSTLPIDAVLVKAQSLNLYIYDPESSGDGGLGAPLLATGGQPGVSHIEFCFDYELTVSKTASAEFTRTYDWTIDKESSASYAMFAGESVDHAYTVGVELAGPVDSDWTVSGSITVANDTPSDAVVTGISDVVSPAIAVTPDCGVSFPYTLAAGSSLSCSYAAALPDGSARVNTATVTTSGPIEGGVATADVLFGDPTTVVGPTDINVDDTNGESWWTSASASWSYLRSFVCPTDLSLYAGGFYSYSESNTATIRETGANDSTTVDVTCYAPMASKTAATSYTRTYSWSILKGVAPSSHLGFPGDSFVSGYDVSVEQTVVESDFAVYGEITVVNPHPSAALDVSVADLVGGSPATLACGGTLTVPAAGSASCGYSASLAGKIDGVNSATVGFNGLSVSASASYAFGDPTTVVGWAAINVDDTNGESWGTSSTASWQYQRGFDCPVDVALYTGGIYQQSFPNTATIRETGQSDDASVLVTCYLPGKAEVIKTVVDGSADIGQYPFGFELIAPNGTVVEIATLGDAGTVAFATEITTAGTWTVREIVPDGWLVDGETRTFNVSFPSAAGQTFSVSFNNTEMARVELLKLTDGSDASAAEWSFALYEGGFGGTLVAADGTPPALLQFGATNLDPGASYTLCEENVPAGWSSLWRYDLDGDGVIADGEVITPYNPNATDDPPADLGNRCVDIGDGSSYPLTPGEIALFKVDNQHPGGEPRTPGYWKNWSSCSGGNQVDTAAANGGPSEGWFILDDLLPQELGELTVASCEDGVALLDHRDLDRNRKRASDAAYKLARNLLAAQLNLAAGAETCPEVLDAVVDGNALLAYIEFDGTGGYLRKGAMAQAAAYLAAQLDDYNNGTLCGPAAALTADQLQ